jgi:hypothetical protein
VLYRVIDELVADHDFDLEQWFSDMCTYKELRSKRKAQAGHVMCFIMVDFSWVDGQSL